MYNTEYIPPENSQPITQPLRVPGVRIWPAVLTLYLLPAMVAEMLSGSTPPLQFINPVVFIFQTGFYGSGALIVRELVRKRGLGWGNLLLLAAAYGILEEGLVNNTWFNLYWPDVLFLGTYSRWLEINWVWALALTVMHMIISITIPIVLVETIFPQVADRPWLSRRAFWLFAGWLSFLSLIGFILFGLLLFRKQGYTHPPLSYALVLIITIGLVWLGLHLRLRTISSPALQIKRFPALWRLRLGAFATTIAFFFAGWILPNFRPSPFVPLLLMISIIVLVTLRIRSWSRRPAWGGAQRLALISGVLGFWIILTPFTEFVFHTNKPASGMTLVGLLFLGGLIWLAFRVRKQTQPEQV